jgi:hypothetical protein
MRYSFNPEAVSIMPQSSVMTKQHNKKRVLSLCQSPFGTTRRGTHLIRGGAANMVAGSH